MRDYKAQYFIIITFNLSNYHLLNREIGEKNPTINPNIITKTEGKIKLVCLGF
jgi:hypothetical protein